MPPTSLRPKPEQNTARAPYGPPRQFLLATLTASLRREATILRSALFGFRGKKAGLAGGFAGESFTYGTTGLLPYLSLLVLIGAVPETWLLHLLLPRHRTLEMILLALGLWGLIWVRGFYCTLRDHPHTIEGGRATFRFGFQRRCTVPLASILTIKTSRNVSRDAFAGYPASERFCVNHCDLLELTLHPEATLEEFTGTRHRVARLAVSFDDAGSFVQAVERSRKANL